eukprot:g7344.t1
MNGRRSSYMEAFEDVWQGVRDVVNGEWESEKYANGYLYCCTSQATARPSLGKRHVEEDITKYYRVHANTFPHEEIMTDMMASSAYDTYTIAEGRESSETLRSLPSALSTAMSTATWTPALNPETGDPKPPRRLSSSYNVLRGPPGENSRIHTAAHSNHAYYEGLCHYRPWPNRNPSWCIMGLGVMGACLPRVVRKKELDELEDVRTKLTWMMALVKSKTKETNISAIDAAFLASCVGRLEKVPKPWAFTSLPVIYWGGEDLLALRLRILPRIVEIERQLERHPERHPERHLEQRRERNMTTGASPGEGITTLLVKHFDWTTNRCFDHGSGVRLRVGRGCLREGQVAGPINVITNERYIVECEGSSFLVSTVVDCQPSSTFEQPLDLENRIGGEDEDPKELEENHKTFWRESVSEPWKLLQGGTVDADCQEQGQFVLRAKVDHFSQFCFGYELNVLSAFQERQLQGVQALQPVYLLTDPYLNAFRSGDHLRDVVVVLVEAR